MAVKKTRMQGLAFGRAIFKPPMDSVVEPLESDDEFSDPEADAASEFVPQLDRDKSAPKVRVSNPNPQGYVLKWSQAKQMMVLVMPKKAPVH